MARFVDSMKVDLAERRRALRQSVRVEVSVEHAGHKHKTQLDDISLSGCRLADNFGFRKDDEIRIELDDASIPARIAWVTDTKAGAQFDQALTALPPRIAAVRAA